MSLTCKLSLPCCGHGLLIKLCPPPQKDKDKLHCRVIHSTEHVTAPHSTPSFLLLYIKNTISSMVHVSVFSFSTFQSHSFLHLSALFYSAEALCLIALHMAFRSKVCQESVKYRIYS